MRLCTLKGVITKISLGYDSCLALTAQGNLYSWGNNSYGKLGIGNFSVQFSPVPLRVKLNQIFKIKCGSNHCMVIKSSGVVFAWGAGLDGQLGNGLFED